MLLVDDGSKDKTWQLISQFNRENPYVEGGEAGPQPGPPERPALRADDRQGPVRLRHQPGRGPAGRHRRLGPVRPEVPGGLRRGVRRAQQAGHGHLVQAHHRRGLLQGDEAAGCGHRLNHADYRLMSKRALEALAEYREVNLFLRGIVPLIGYRSDYVYYDRHERFAGESKIPPEEDDLLCPGRHHQLQRKALKAHLQPGHPHLGAQYSGAAVRPHLLLRRLGGARLDATVCSIWLLGGLQMLCLGVVGGYIGKIYSEVKARPRFRVEEFLPNDGEDK